MRRVAKQHWLPLLVFSSAGLYAVWPLPLHFTTRVAGTYGDGFQNLFNLWWMSEAITHGENPYFTPYMFHPFGVSLLLHTLSPYNSVPGAVLSLFTGLATAYNTLILAHYVLAGFSMYLLALYLLSGDEGEHKGATRWAALYSGLVYTLSPFHFYQGREHLQLTAVETVPLALLCLVKLLDRPGRKRAAALGLSAALVAFTDMYLLIFAAIASIFLIVARAFSLRKEVKGTGRATAIGLLQALAVFALSAGPLLAAMALHYAASPTVSGHDPAVYSADLQSLLVPGPGSAWAPWFASIHRSWKGNPTEHTGYLGYLLTIFSVFGITKRAKLDYKYTFAGIAVFSLLLSLGPKLEWGGTVLSSSMPYSWLSHAVPVVFTFTGTPARFSFLVNLCQAALAGAGLLAVSSMFEASAPKKPSTGGGNRIFATPRTTFVACLAAAAIVELAPGPHETASIEPPAVFRKWADDGLNYSVLDTRRWSQMYLGLITHHKPLVNGHISRDPLDRLKHLKDIPVFDTLVFKRGCFGLDFEVSKSSRTNTLNIDTGDAPVLEGCPNDYFVLILEGEVLVNNTGPSRFSLKSSDPFMFWFDGELKLDTTSRPGPAVFTTGPLSIDSGWHAFQVRVFAGSGSFFFDMKSESMDGSFHTLSGGKLRSPMGGQGVAMGCGPRLPLLSGPKQIRAGLDALKAHDVKYIVRWPWENQSLEKTRLKLERIYEDDLAVVYEVPLEEKR